MLLYVILHIVFAYLMLFAALTNAVCLNNASSFSFLFVIDLCKCFLFSCFVFVYFIFLFASCTVLLIYLVFLIICSHRCCLFFLNIFL